MKILGIIPARGGSKGVLRKNTRKLAGKSLIAYSIALGKACESFMDTVVSTDDNEIEAISLSLGASVIRRPAELGSDVSNVADTVLQVLQQLQERGQSYDIVILLQPTSPLRTKKDIENVISLLNDSSEIDGVISVVKVVDHHPARMYSISEKKEMQPYLKELETSRRQDLDALYIRNGCIYAVRTAYFLREKSLMPTNKIAYIMDSRWAVNVDTETDLELLEIVMPKWKVEYEDSNS
jgi:CMP-N-acetylneuraminic acid synthetase